MAVGREFLADLIVLFDMFDQKLSTFRLVMVGDLQQTHRVFGNREGVIGEGGSDEKSVVGQSFQIQIQICMN